jgi:hypothetical protein
MRIALLTAFILLFTDPLCSYAQDASSVIDNTFNFPSKLFSRINDKTSRLNGQLAKQTERYLNKLSRQEARLRKKLYKLDSVKAAGLYTSNPEQQYALMIAKLSSDTARSVHSMGPEYLPYTDSLQASLAFMSKNPQMIPHGMNADQAATALAQLQTLETKFQDADEIKQFVRQRKEQIGQFLSGYSHLPSGISNTYNGYNKELYYYSEQLRQYRQMLNDPDKMLKRALTLLNKLPAFTTFMKGNSFLTGLFSVASNYGSADGLDGLQSRDQVLTMIQGRIGSGGPNAASAIQSSLQTAQQDINSLQNKLSKLGGGSGDIDMPNFKPNAQRTKTFFQRLEYSTNLQTQRAAYYFPTTTDLGLSVGYKLGEKNVIGIGASYKVGWGSNINHVNVSGQGAGLRSFMDIQMKKSFFASGGFEYNYQPILGATIGTLNSWQQSGLIGISKVVSMNTKVFKKTKVQFLWDFLSYEQVPKGQPVKFRVGYTF